MDDDKFDEILKAIENLRNNNDLAHEGLGSMIKDVQRTQEEHTKSFDKITKAISRSVMGRMVHAINVLEDYAGLPKTDWHDKS